MRLGDFDQTVCSDQQIRKGHLTLVISIYCRTHISFKLDDIASSYASRGKAQSKISSCRGPDAVNSISYMKYMKQPPAARDL